jgi:hypothetical protein
MDRGGNGVCRGRSTDDTLSIRNFPLRVSRLGRASCPFSGLCNRVKATPTDISPTYYEEQFSEVSQFESLGVGALQESWRGGDPRGEVLTFFCAKQQSLVPAKLWHYWSEPPK